MKTKIKLMANALAIIISSFITLNTRAQSPNWLWAKSAGGANNDVSSFVSMDSKGNLYATGSFASSSITFGINTLTNTNSGTNDVYLVKYDHLGNVLWAKSAGGASDDYSLSVTTDAYGNVYISGYYKSSSITFGTNTLTNASPPYGDYFLVKYDSSGNVLWAKTEVGSTSSVAINSIFAYKSGIYGVGQFSSTSVTFGTYTLNNTNAPNQDIFIVKFDVSGNVLWAKEAGGTGNDFPNSVSVASGGLVLSGYYNSSALTFGANTLTNANAGTNDIFIAKYDSLGNVLWAKSAGGAGDDYGMAVSINSSGNIYASGYYKSSSITFGTNTLTNGNPPYGDYFLVKYDGLGNVLWAETEVGSASSIAMNSLYAVDSGVYCVGQFSSSSITFGVNILNNPNTPDERIFMVKFDNSGNVVWAESAGGAGNDNSFSVSADNKGNLSIGGGFYSPTLTLGYLILNNAGTGTEDMFVSQLYDSTAISTSVISINEINEMELYPNPSKGNIHLLYKGLMANTKFQILNVYGEIIGIYTIRNTKGRLDINESNLSNGMYFYEYTSKNNVPSIGKFLINK